MMSKWKQLGIEVISVGAAGGLLVAIAPQPVRNQVLYGTIAAVAPIMVISQGWRYTSKLNEELKLQKAELERVAALQEKARESLDKRSAQVELREADIRSQMTALENARRDRDFEFREQAAQMEAGLQEGAIALEKMRAAIDADRSALQASIRQWEEIDREVMKLELRSQLEAERQEMVAQWEKQKSDLREQELNRIRQLENDYLNKAIALEKSRSDWEIEKSQLQRQHEEAIATEYQEMRSHVDVEADKLKQQVFEQAAKQFATQRDNWLKEIDKLNQVIKQLRSECIALHEKIAKERKPVRPQGTSPSHAIAYVVQDWFLSHGVPWDFVSIQWVESQSCWAIACEPWWEHGVQKKDFARLAGISQSGLKLTQEFEVKDSGDGFKIFIKPIASIQAQVENVLQLKNSLLNGSDYEMELDAPSLISLPENKAEHSRLERKNEFLRFSGTALTQGYFPIYGDIAPLEKKTVEFWMRYQSVCFGKPNLEDGEAIAKIYGIKPKMVESKKSDYEAALARLSILKQDLHII